MFQSAPRRRVVVSKGKTQTLTLMSKDTYISNAHGIFSEIDNILDHKISVNLF